MTRDDEDMVARSVRRETSCGVLLFQRQPRLSFLVLYRKDGTPDLPKGHVERGETDVQAALRELAEEAGIDDDVVTLTDGFVFENTYPTRAKKSGEPIEKTVRVFHGVVDGPVVVDLSDHADYAWIPWGPVSTLESVLRPNPTFLGAVRAWDAWQKEHR